MIHHQLLYDTAAEYVERAVDYCFPAQPDPPTPAPPIYISDQARQAIDQAREADDEATDTDDSGDLLENVDLELGPRPADPEALAASSCEESLDTAIPSRPLHHQMPPTSLVDDISVNKIGAVDDAHVLVRLIPLMSTVAIWRYSYKASCQCCQTELSRHL